MTDKIEKCIDMVCDWVDEVGTVRTKNVAYVLLTLIATIISVAIITQEPGYVLSEFIGGILSETNIVFSMAFMNSSINDSTNGMQAVFVFPALYIFVSKVIYYFLKQEDILDNILQIIGNCFLQIFISVHIISSPMNIITKVIVIFMIALVVYMTGAMGIAMVKSKNFLWFFPVWLKYISYIFRIPIIRRGFTVVIAYMIQLLAFLPFAAAFQFLHLEKLLLPLAFLITPLCLNKIADKFIEWVDKRGGKEAEVRDDMICFVFALLVLVLGHL